jgi:hypothetical protein
MKTSLLLLLFSPIFCLSQNQSWLIGNIINPTPSTAFVIDFKQNNYNFPPYVRSWPIEKYRISQFSNFSCFSNISDTLGNLILNYDQYNLQALPYRDTNAIVDLQKYKLFRWPLLVDKGAGTYNNDYFQANMILPDPIRAKHYSVLSLDTKDKLTWTLYYSLVDMTNPYFSGNPSGNRILKKRITIKNDAYETGGLMACRHPNGRDWWLLIGKRDSLNRLSTDRFVIDSSGVKLDGVQNTSYETTLNNEMNGKNIGDVRVIYSPDGKFMCRGQFNYYPQAYFELFPFNRCTGEIDVDKVKKISYVTPSIVANGGFAFSPNSKFLYLSNGSTLHQYDIENDIDSIIIVKANPSGDCSRGACALNDMVLAPDDRIYLISQFGTAISVIFNPNERGTACNIALDTLKVPYRLESPYFPSHPHYRLGKMDCDTKTNELGAEYFIRISPNPGMEYFRIYGDELPDGATIHVYDVLGRQVHSAVFQSGDRIDTSQWQNGVYIYQIKQKDAVLNAGKWSKSN